MKLTKENLYKLIKEEVERMYQVKRDALNRLIADQDVPPKHLRKLITLLTSGDPASIASAEELMDTFGYGEVGKDGEDITVRNIPITDKSTKWTKTFKKYKPKDQRLPDGVKKYAGMKYSEKENLKLLSDAILNEFKKYLATKVEQIKQRYQGEEEPFRFIVSDVYDQIYSMGRGFTDRVAAVYPNMESNNFAGLQDMRDALEERMKQHYIQVYQKSKEPST
tara:strand:+ start:2259 stop:2924 length:666 start_codon:yes stop_codon:yes gene_type:complete